MIRVWDTLKGRLLHEFRRGSDYAQIFSMSWHPSLSFLAVTSHKETIHIFKLAPLAADAPALERRNSDDLTPNNNSSNPVVGVNASIGGTFAFMKDYLPVYFSSEWSFAQAKTKEGPSYVAFTPDGHHFIGNIIFDIFASHFIHS